MHLDGLATLATLNITTTQLCLKDSLVRNQAAAEVVLESQTDQERNDPASPTEATGVTIVGKVWAVARVPGDTDTHLDELDEGPDKGADDIEFDKHVDLLKVLLVCTHKTEGRDGGDSEVGESEDDKDCMVPAYFFLGGAVIRKNERG